MSRNCFINLFVVVLSNFNIIISQPCVNGPWKVLYDPRKLRSLVRRGHAFLEQRSCLTFVEQNPVDMAAMLNTTYLYYTFSGALEICCFHYYAKPIGRRIILITPICTLPAEVAHATLHGMGLEHLNKEPFPELNVRAALFATYCPDIAGKVRNFGLL